MSQAVLAFPGSPAPPSRRTGYRKDGAPHPNHHLWRNGRLWWIAITVHRPDWTAERVRRSLCTEDVVEARRRRDWILSEYREVHGCQLSLRY